MCFLLEFAIPALFNLIGVNLVIVFRSANACLTWPKALLFVFLFEGVPTPSLKIMSVQALGM
jgi:hypothetical protein